MRWCIWLEIFKNYKRQNWSWIALKPGHFFIIKTLKGVWALRVILPLWCEFLFKSRLNGTLWPLHLIYVGLQVCCVHYFKCSFCFTYLQLHNKYEVFREKKRFRSEELSVIDRTETRDLISCLFPALEKTFLQFILLVTLKVRDVPWTSRLPFSLL